MTIEIPLTQGKVALIDDADLALVSKYKWCVMNSRHTSYAMCAMPADNNRKLYMHRIILSAPVGIEVDHVNSNGLDNTRANIRLCTASQNRCNADHKSKRLYRGVRQSGPKWQAFIGWRKKQTYLGIYDTAEDAARSYDEAARRLHGEFARLNFG